MTTLEFLAPLVILIATYVVIGWACLRLYLKQKGPVRRAALIAAVLILFDAVATGHGVLTFLVVLVAVPLQLGMAVWRAVRHDGRLALAHLAACGIYILALLLVAGSMRVNDRIAGQRAEALIAACKAYKAQHAEFPGRLDDLVPTFLSAIPRTRYTIMFNRFMYFSSTDTSRSPRHVLVYETRFPARRLYHLEEDRWSTLD